MRTLLTTTAIGIMSFAISDSAFADIRITEWMYSGSEFVELTNIGGSSVDLTGWSYSDSARVAGEVSLSSLGLVAPGQSVIIAEDTAIAFRALWSLSASVAVLGGNTVNLGRNDEINIYDASNTLVDRLTYGDQDFPGTIRTQNFSGWTSPSNLGTNTVSAWGLSVVGDAQNSYAVSPSPLAGTDTFVANPGTYVVPTPGALALLGLAGLVGARRRRVA